MAVKARTVNANHLVLHRSYLPQKNSNQLCGILNSLQNAYNYTLYLFIKSENAELINFSTTSS